MRESFKSYSIQKLRRAALHGAARLALAICLALPLAYAWAHPKSAANDAVNDAINDAVIGTGDLIQDNSGAGRTLPAAQTFQLARADVSGPDLSLGRQTGGGTRAVLSGEATVIDGDTLDIAGQRVRLEGIDAPERGQRCERANGSHWRCGRSATRALRKMIAKKQVRCIDLGRGTYGRILGRCFIGKTQINRELVRQGLAWAFVKYSVSYVAVEQAAKARRIGIWQGRAVPAWDYRSGAWDVAQVRAPQGCAIKGNISRNGRIYHMPWGNWYARVKINLSRGERWFCSQSEAESAGWRAAQS